MPTTPLPVHLGRMPWFRTLTPVSVVPKPLHLSLFLTLLLIAQVKLVLKVPMLKKLMFWFILLLGAKLTWTPLRPTLGRVSRHLVVATTLVMFVPLLVLSSAALLARTSARFPKNLSLGKLVICTASRSPSVTLLLLHLLTMWGPILPLSTLGDALIRVTKLTMGVPL